MVTPLNTSLSFSKALPWFEGSVSLFNIIVKKAPRITHINELHSVFICPKYSIAQIE